ncbi:unnamed protein product, partial [Sphacelaria rigidula]
LQSDRGGEDVADYFKKYCKTTGIRQEFTNPYTPQQNGISERDGRSILNVTRCLLNESNLPKFLWGEIVATAVFLINRLPHTSIGGDTPYFFNFLKQPKLSSLRTIGSRAFVHRERHHSKLEEKAWEGGLVGYDSDRPSYRIYNCYSRKISSSRNVIHTA